MQVEEERDLASLCHGTDNLIIPPQCMVQVSSVCGLCRLSYNDTLSFLSDQGLELTALLQYCVAPHVCPQEPKLTLGAEALTPSSPRIRSGSRD